MYNKGWIRFERETAIATHRNGEYSQRKGRVLKHKAYHKPAPVIVLDPGATPAIVSGFGPISQRTAVIYGK